MLPHEILEARTKAANENILFVDRLLAQKAQMSKEQLAEAEKIRSDAVKIKELYMCLKWDN